VLAIKTCQWPNRRRSVKAEGLADRIENKWRLEGVRVTSKSTNFPLAAAPIASQECWVEFQEQLSDLCQRLMPAKSSTMKTGLRPEVVEAFMSSLKGRRPFTLGGRESRRVRGPQGGSSDELLASLEPAHCGWLVTEFSPIRHEVGEGSRPVSV
jgi:hypothetical protein